MTNVALPANGQGRGGWHYRTDREKSFTPSAKGQTEPSAGTKSQFVSLQPGEPFNPRTLPPELRERVEKGIRETTALNDGEKLAWFILASYLPSPEEETKRAPGLRGCVWPTYDRIARESGKSKRTVIRRVRALITKDFCRYKTRRHGRPKSGDHKGNDLLFIYQEPSPVTQNSRRIKDEWKGDNHGTALDDMTLLALLEVTTLSPESSSSSILLSATEPAGAEFGNRSTGPKA